MDKSRIRYKKTNKDLTTQQAVTICEEYCQELRQLVPEWDGTTGTLIEFDYCSAWFYNLEGSDLKCYQGISPCVVNSFSVVDASCIP